MCEEKKKEDVFLLIDKDTTVRPSSLLRGHPLFFHFISLYNRLWCIIYVWIDQIFLQHIPKKDQNSAFYSMLR